ncbi:MAG TPA: cache domain-containing protein [Euzebyales bacterium]|nr:cache domain-containing protein [Euzebyales bacterium]
MKLTAAVRAANDKRRDSRESKPRNSDRPLRRSLQGKILSRALLISIVPLLLIASVTLGSLLGLSRSTDARLERSREDLLRNVVGRNVREDAMGVTRQVEQLMAERIGNVMDWSDSPVVVEAAFNAAEERGDTLRETSTSAELEDAFSSDRRLEPGSAAERYLRGIAERQPMFAEIFFTERNGMVVASSQRTPDFIQRDEDWWAHAWTHGLHVSHVFRDASAEEHGVSVSVRIDDPRTEEPLGVMKAVIGLEVLQQTVSEIANRTTSDVSLLTRNEMLIAESASNHGRARIMNPSVQFTGAVAEAYQTALASTNPGYLLQEDTVAGYMSLISTSGQLWTMLEDGGVDPNVLDFVAVVQDTNDDALAPLVGLDDVQEGVNSTGRTFVILGLLALLAAVAAAFVVSTRLANGIVRPLRALRRTAHDIADRQLPALISQIQHSESEEDLPQVPSVELDTDDEVEDVADAFNVVRSTAVELAAEQARSRRNVARMFVSLGRRNQGLLSRQLEFIDRLESEESNPELLDNLFRLDHLATRMRRNAESLLVLAGEQPSRRWAEPVSLTDVVRGAVAEVEDYQRVNLEGIDEAQLAGTAVGDVSHLLAELIENATHFSPPDSTVMVLGRRVTDGYALAIVDDGVGMTEEQLRAANERIESSPQIERVPSSYLGLFVVGRLAARHDIKVRLVESTTEGVTAKVLLPNTLVEPLPPEWPPADDTPRHDTGELRGYDERAVPVAVGGPQGSAFDLAEPEPPAHTSPPPSYQPPPQPRPVAEPVAMSDDTADLPGLGVRRRSSKRRDDGAELAGRESARAAGPAAGRGGGSGPRKGREGGAPAPRDGRGAGAQPSRDGREGGGPVPRDGRGAGAQSSRDGRGTGAQPSRDGRGTGGPVPRDGRGTPGPAPEQPSRSNGRPEPVSARGGDRHGVPTPPDAPRVFEVQRRTSKRREAQEAAEANGVVRDRTVLRTEPAAAADGNDGPEPRAGQASTDAERNAQAAKERLARFQRAVRQGRAQTGGPLSSSERNGGDRRDA